jgi:PST family polysaccharide transporter
VIVQKLSPSLRKAAGNATWLLVDRLVRLFLSLLVGAWVARYLAPSQYGLYNYGFAFVSLFQTFTGLGLQQILVRDLVNNSEEKDAILGTAFWLRIIAGIATVPLIVGLNILLRPDDATAHWIVGAISLSLIFQPFDVIEFWFVSQVQSKQTVIAKSAAFFIINACKVILIVLSAPVLAFAIAVSAEVALNAIGLVIAYRAQSNFMKLWFFSCRWAKKLLEDSWTLILCAMVISIYMRTDQLMLAQMSGDEVVGLYSAAAKVSEMWFFIPAALVQSATPSIIEARQFNMRLYYKRIEKLLKVIVFLSYCIAIIVTLGSSYVIILLFGEDFSDSASILSIHIWTGVFVSMGLVAGVWTTTEGLMIFSFVATASGAALNICLNLLLIPIYGGIGAAIATVIAQVMASFAAFLVFPRARCFFFCQLRALLPNPFVLLNR